MESIAVIGATSQIAKDLVRTIAPENDYSVRLFSRRPQELKDWCVQELISGDIISLPYEKFIEGKFDTVINCVGSGDPARTAAMGGSILDITYEYDSLALAYLRRYPDCRYIFLSSGAAYGAVFREPAELGTNAVFPINSLSPSDFYAIAKIHAECRHRSVLDAAIVDIRIFGYCSSKTDMKSKFFTSDILRSIYNKETLSVSLAPMWRDFITPTDFSELVLCILRAPAFNGAVDAFSRAPVEKFELLDHLTSVFEFRYETTVSSNFIQPTGEKPRYYSNNHSAENLGYLPRYTSIEGVTREISEALDSFKKIG